jgi:4-hydroxy-tetrahydrodipicolinate synthase
MAAFTPGLVHTPVTPFSRDRSIDFALYGKLIDFHLGHGAQSLALPMHAGESVSLTGAERRQLVEFAIAHLQGRAPVVVHVSEAGTGLAVALARHAQQAGAAAIVATTPYYWTPPAAMLVEHFYEIGAAVEIPLFIYNAPEEMQGTRVTAELCRTLIAKLPNLAGVVDLSLDWQVMIELMTDAPRLRPGFQLISGTELMVSPAAIGAVGMFAPLAGAGYRLEEDGSGRVLVQFGDRIKNFHIYVFYAARDFAQKSPDPLRAFLKAWFEGIDYMREHREATIELVHRTAEVSQGIAARDYDELMPMFNRTGKFDSRALNELARSFVEMGLLPHAPDVRVLVTEEYLPSIK